jgi:hypothetical protein
MNFQSFPKHEFEQALVEKHRTEEINNDIIIRYGDLPTFLAINANAYNCSV